MTDLDSTIVNSASLNSYCAGKYKRKANILALFLLAVGLVMVYRIYGKEVINRAGQQLDSQRKHILKNGKKPEILKLDYVHFGSRSINKVNRIFLL